MLQHNLILDYLNLKNIAVSKPKLYRKILSVDFQFEELLLVYWDKNHWDHMTKNPSKALNEVCVS